jgi:hypothetical protein
VHTNDFVINHRTTRKAIECIAKLFPHFDGETAATFIIETIDTVNSGTLMVAPQEEKVFGVLDFVCEEETNHFQ